MNRAGNLLHSTDDDCWFRGVHAVYRLMQPGQILHSTDDDCWFRAWTAGPGVPAGPSSQAGQQETAFQAPAPPWGWSIELLQNFRDNAAHRDDRAYLTHSPRKSLKYRTLRGEAGCVVLVDGLKTGSSASTPESITTGLHPEPAVDFRGRLRQPRPETLKKASHRLHMRVQLLPSTTAPREIQIRVLRNVVFGRESYPLRGLHVGSYHPQTGRFEVPAASPQFVGSGTSVEAALKDWQEKVHTRFQVLHRKRPFEMIGPEKEEWAILDRLINVEAYLDNTPLIVRQVGALTQVRPYIIRWIDQSDETIRLETMPAEFARFGPGDWFEAIVERDRKTWELRRTIFVHPTAPVRPMSPAEAADYFGSIPKEKLPPSDRDWTKK